MVKAKTKKLSFEASDCWGHRRTNRYKRRILFMNEWRRQQWELMDGDESKKWKLIRQAGTSIERQLISWWKIDGCSARAAKETRNGSAFNFLWLLSTTFSICFSEPTLSSLDKKKMVLKLQKIHLIFGCLKKKKRIWQKRGFNWNRNIIDQSINQVPTSIIGEISGLWLSKCNLKSRLCTASAKS